MCISMARTQAELEQWWRDPKHNREIAALPPALKARVIAAKDRRKEQLSHEKASHRVA